MEARRRMEMMVGKQRRDVARRGYAQAEQLDKYSSLSKYLSMYSHMPPSTH